MNQQAFIFCIFALFGIGVGTGIADSIRTYKEGFFAKWELGLTIPGLGLVPVILSAAPHTRKYTSTTSLILCNVVFVILSICAFYIYRYVVKRRANKA